MTRYESRTAPARLRLKPADSFDLIRLLARSQSDPRKAVAELVQNSLDAEAARVDVTWLKVKGERVLKLVDDGKGIFPQETREDALRRIATTIGHSHKRDLTPAQRRELMALGKYGIGLLGFWAVGRTMTIKSRVGGSDAWALTLEEDCADARLERARKRLDDPPTFTEITIHGVHEGAARQIRPGRLQAYLASELRGQLLERGTAVHIHDRVARGIAVKEFVVVAQQFVGRPLAQPRALTVPGHEDARVELYLVSPDEDRTGRVQLHCGGTTVLDDLADVDGTGELRAPWSYGRLEGVVDFPELEVPPGTRRGFRRDDAASAFLQALAGLEAELVKELAEDDQRRERHRDENLARELRRVFRPVARTLREYEWFDLERGGRGSTDAPAPDAPMNAGDAPPSTPATEPGPAGAPGAAVPAPEEAAVDDGEVDTTPRLFPPGPLAWLRIVPAANRIPPGGLRTLRARALDAERRPVEGVGYAWTLEGPGELRAQGARADFHAASATGAAVVRLTAAQGEVTLTAEAVITIDDNLSGAQNAEGIPEPIPVTAPSEPWRSRLVEGAWQYNTGHRDYVIAAGDEARRLRYLACLLAKEVVLRNFGKPGDGQVLERMVELMTHLDESRGRKRARPVAAGGAEAEA